MRKGNIATSCLAFIFCACTKGGVNLSQLSQGGSGGGGGGGNSAPVITPANTGVQKISLGTAATMAAVVSDADGDPMTCSWKLNGANSAQLTSSRSGETCSAQLTGVTSLVGDALVSLTVDDGQTSATYDWTVEVNHFHQTCNDIDTLNQTNRTCVFSGLASIGDGAEPLTSASSFLLQPADVLVTATGDVFLSDSGNSVIWFWNRTVSPAQTMLGVSVPVNKMRVVAGAGTLGASNSASGFALRTLLTFPSGLAFDGTHLYIADTSNNRVVRVDSANALTAVLTSGCQGPRGLAIHGGILFVACTASHKVMSVDTSTLTATTLAGTGTAGNPSSATGPPTDSTLGKLSQPYGLAVDAAGNVYIAENSGCKLRVVNRTAGSLTFFSGGLTVTSGNFGVLAGPLSPNCSHSDGSASSGGTARLYNPARLSFHSTGVLLISETMGHRISVLNLTGASVAILGTTVSPDTLKAIAGNGVAGYIGEGGAPTATRFNQPQTVVEDLLSGGLLVADTLNYRLRRFSGSSPYSGQTVTGAGFLRSSPQTYNLSSNVASERTPTPKALAYDPFEKSVFVYNDGSGSYIRRIDKYGRTEHTIGQTLSGLGSEENVSPGDSSLGATAGGMVLTHGSAAFGGNLVWSDTANHRIRVWNRSASTAVLFGVTVDAGRVATVGGNGTSGNATSGPAAAQAAFNNPGGLAFDSLSGGLYVTDTGNHCVKKISADGTLTSVAGTCGTAGSVNGPVGTARFNSPEAVAFYRLQSASGLFIADRGNSRVRFHLLSSDQGTEAIAGAPISVGSAASIAGGGSVYSDGVVAANAMLGATYGIATSGNRVCFTVYAHHNVRCVNISTGIISTVFGFSSGEDATPLYFPGLALSLTGQNGLPAFLPASSVPALSDSVGGLTAFPQGISFLDENTLLITEQSPLIRKLRLP